MLQSVRKEMSEESGKKYSFPELIAMAKEADGFPSIVECNDQSFLAPKSMTQAVRDFCKKSGQPVPESMGEVMVVIYNSLAKSYAETFRQLEEMSGRTYSRLHIVGGGCQDAFLNHKTKLATGKEVFAGPVEGTALGNLMVQMLKDGVFASLEEARGCVAASFDVKPVE
jgi:rhamnulokinase